MMGILWQTALNMGVDDSIKLRTGFVYWAVVQPGRPSAVDSGFSSAPVKAEHCEVRTLSATDLPDALALAGRTGRPRMSLPDPDRTPNVTQIVQHRCYDPQSVPARVNAGKGELYGWTDGR